MVLVYRKKVKGPATHAIVIGVGYYSYLPGGKNEKKYLKPERLGQLTSPPHSAREFTDWLLTKFRNTENPLSSVELLLSEKNDSYYQLSSNKRKKVNRATTMTTIRAINRWKDRGDKNKDNLMIFYFCGHGVACGSVGTILLEDFGESHNNPFFNSINFNHFETAMDGCTAKKQCYFIDACRVGSQQLIGTFGGYYGQPVLQAESWPKTRKVAVFYSTGEGKKAYSKKNSPSIFTQALLKALNGAGSNNLWGPWQVSTNWLNTALTELMPVLYHEVDQNCTVGKNDKLLIHQIEGNPVIPVVVSCLPKNANSSAQLSYSDVKGENKVHRETPEPSDWIIEIESGRYRFNADFSTRKYRSNFKEKEVRPPIVPVPIEV